MAATEIETQPRTDALLDRIDILHMNDVEKAQSEHVEWFGLTQNSLALPFCIVLSAAALRGEGLDIPHWVERRVVDTLHVSHRGWADAVLDTKQALGPEATNGSGAEYMSVALSEEARQMVHNRAPIGYFALREMVQMAARQEEALRNQVAIVMHNISVEAQQ